MFDVELRGETAIVTPGGDLRELDFQEIEAGEKEVLVFLERTHVRDVIVDLNRMDYGGSTALEFFMRLSTSVRSRNGCMIFCNVSERQKEILRLADLDGMWPIHRSKEEALRSIKGADHDPTRDDLTSTRSPDGG